ncbi:MAG TPA: hypothetical protein VMS74_07570 [Acidimicrobiia bacterium]|nr:hypothetical protein [Acidimicrobiia bacterium]
MPGDDLKRPTIALNGETMEVYVGVSRLDRSASSVLVASSADLDTWHHQTVFDVEDRNAQSLYNMRLPRHPVDADIGLPVVVVEQTLVVPLDSCGVDIATHRLHPRGARLADRSSSRPW